jgi:tRNA(Phe) wybutosine-synthesizing methylase Tyw3
MKIQGMPLDRGIEDVIRAINAVPGLHTSSSCSGTHHKNVGAHVIIKFDTRIRSIRSWITRLNSSHHLRLRRTHAPSKLRSNYETYIVYPAQLTTPREFWTALRQIFDSKRSDDVNVKYVKRFLK